MLAPRYLQGFWQDGFTLKAHLADYLGLDEPTLAAKLASGTSDLATLGHRDFDWDTASVFYGEATAGELYLFDLAAWHLNSQDHIGDSLRLIADFAQGQVLDFGGGIGTHTIAAALNPAVDRVFYCDLNPVLTQFVRERVAKLGLTEKVWFGTMPPADQQFATVLCFDVLEHLPNPTQQLHHFHQLLVPQGHLITNWYFFKGFAEEFPFHLDYRDQAEAVTTFYETLPLLFLEQFHPYPTTTRCYVARQLPERLKN